MRELRELVDGELPTFLPTAEMRPVQLDEACVLPASFSCYTDDWFENK